MPTPGAGAAFVANGGERWRTRNSPRAVWRGGGAGKLEKVTRTPRPLRPAVQNNLPSFNIVLVPRNLPPHGNEPFLPIGKIVEARRKFGAPPPKPSIVDPKPPKRVDQQYLAKLQAQYREQQLRLAKESLQAQGDPAQAELALDDFQEI